jgi:hypothetical protein
MSVSILEALQNARYNLIDNRGVGLAWTFGKNQLDNAIKLLEKGYGIDEEVGPLIEKYGDAESVPENTDQ